MKNDARNADPMQRARYHLKALMSLRAIIKTISGDEPLTEATKNAVAQFARELMVINTKPSAQETLAGIVALCGCVDAESTSVCIVLLVHNIQTDPARSAILLQAISELIV